MKMIMGRISLLCVFALAACSGGGGDNHVEETDDDQQEVEDPNNGLKAPAPWTNVTFTTEDVEVKAPGAPAGDHGVLVRAADGTLYYVYYRSTTNRTCDIAVFGGGPAPSIAWDMAVAVKGPSASSFTVETVPLGSTTGAAGARGALDYVSNPNGIDAVVDNSNRLVFAAPAGGDGLFVCASSDLVRGTRTGANTYTMNAIVTASAAGGGPVAGGGNETCPQDGACASGTDVGAWPAIAVRTGGNLAIAYSDLHNATDDDGLTDADFELWQPSGVTGIRQWSGAGRWAKLREINGNLVVAHSSYPSGAGAYVLTLGGNGKWTGQDQSFGAVVGERLQLEVAPNGTVGLVYYAIRDNSDRVVEDLYYCESLDHGVTFPTCSKPETATLIAGANPSFAYDSQSHPVLSYYYCGSNGCPHDGLRVAWLDSTGKWWKYNVRNIDNNRSGFYSSVVIDPATDEPIIAFQDLTRGAAMVAYGNF